MDSMIEKVAKAMAEPYMWVARTPAALKREPWREFIPAARAAIEAMREPTEAMVQAGESQMEPTDDRHHIVSNVWQSMIDATLDANGVGNTDGIPIYATTEGHKETFQGKRKS